ncbi:hypothetical protein EDB89DRAFT_1903595 [Lactarius sanguifluus]|nr:hypothetical protein EDB89DRAFT_1903595 [Lactarius sanguifluus]
MSDYKVGLAVLARQLALIRIESHHSPGLFLRIWLAVRRPTGFIPWVVMDLFLFGTPQTVVTPLSPVTADDTAFTTFANGRSMMPIRPGGCDRLLYRPCKDVGNPSSQSVRETAKEKETDVRS